MPINSDLVVVGTDPGGTEVARFQSMRAGPGTIGTWRPIGVIKPTSNVTSVQFAGLGITPPAVLRLYATVRNPTASSTIYQIRVNGEPDTTDWVMQAVWGDGTTVAAQRFLDASDIGACDLGFDTSIMATITVGPGGYVTVVAPFVHPRGVDLLNSVIDVSRKNTAITSLTSVEVVATVVNTIGANSVFFLEYLAP